MLRRILIALLFLGVALPAAAQITIAHISDIHLGLKLAPGAAGNLRRVVEMVNQRNPDAVIVSGDIGENPKAWKKAREILSQVKAPGGELMWDHDGFLEIHPRLQSQVEVLTQPQGPTVAAGGLCQRGMGNRRGSCLHRSPGGLCPRLFQFPSTNRTVIKVSTSTGSPLRV